MSAVNLPADFPIYFRELNFLLTECNPRDVCPHHVGKHL